MAGSLTRSLLALPSPRPSARRLATSKSERALFSRTWAFSILPMHYWSPHQTGWWISILDILLEYPFFRFIFKLASSDIWPSIRSRFDLAVLYLSIAVFNWVSSAPRLETWVMIIENTLVGNGDGNTILKLIYSLILVLIDVGGLLLPLWKHVVSILPFNQVQNGRWCCHDLCHDSYPFGTAHNGLIYILQLFGQALPKLAASHSQCNFSHKISWFS